MTSEYLERPLRSLEQAAADKKPAPIVERVWTNTWVRLSGVWDSNHFSTEAEAIEDAAELAENWLLAFSVFAERRLGGEWMVSQIHDMPDLVREARRDAEDEAKNERGLAQWRRT